MGILTDDMKRTIAEQRLIFAATVCPDGTPNLSPKGTAMVWDDDHVLFTDLASPGTMGNLERNQAIELNVVDVFLRKGYRFKGTASVHARGDVFDAAVQRMRAGPAQALVSPGYWGGATEGAMRRDWETYWAGVAAAYHGSTAGQVSD